MNFASRALRGEGGIFMARAIKTLAALCAVFVLTIIIVAISLWPLWLLMYGAFAKNKIAFILGMFVTACRLISAQHDNGERLLREHGINM